MYICNKIINESKNAEHMNKFVFLLFLLISMKADISAQNSVLDSVRAENINLFLNRWENGLFAKCYKNNLRKRVNKMIRHKKELGQIKNLKEFHIYEMYPSDVFLWKRNYLDYSFLDHLTCRAIHEGRITNKIKEYARATVLITDSVGNLLAYGDDSVLVPIFDKPHERPYVRLAELLFNGEVDFMFELPFERCYVYGKDNKLYVLEKGKNYELVLSSWEEYVERKEIIVNE